MFFLDGRVKPDVAAQTVDKIHVDNRPSDLEPVCQNQDEQDQRARLEQDLAPLFFHHIATFINCTIQHLEFMAGVHFVGNNHVLNSPTNRYIMSPFYGKLSGDVPPLPGHRKLTLNSEFPDNYPKFIRTDVFNALKGNDPIVYTVEFKDVFSEFTMKDTKTLFIQIFNLIFEKYGISAENKDEHSVGEPYGRITLSMFAPSGAAGSVDQIDLFSPIIGFNFNPHVQITASIIVHEILHALGLIHSDVGVDNYMSASSYLSSWITGTNLTYRYFYNNWLGVDDYRFITELMAFFGRDKIENTDSFDLSRLGYDQHIDPISVVLPPDVNHVKAEFWYSENSNCSFRILTGDELPKNTLFGCDATPAAKHGTFVYVSTDVVFSSKVFLVPSNKRLALNVRFESIYGRSDESYKTYELEILNGELNVVEITNGKDLNSSNSPDSDSSVKNNSNTQGVAVSDSSVKNNSNPQGVADTHNGLSSMDLFIIIGGLSAIGITLLSVLYCFCLFLKDRFPGQEMGGAVSTAPAHSLLCWTRS